MAPARHVPDRHGSQNRFGETLALRRTDVDWDEGTVSNSKTMYRNGKTGETKIQAGTRTLPLRPETLEQLKAQHHRVVGFDWVFPSRTGRALDEPNVSPYVVRRSLRDAGITRRVRTHDLRHTFARRELNAGKPLDWVSQYMGHSSFQITHDLYGGRSVAGLRAGLQPGEARRPETNKAPEGISSPGLSSFLPEVPPVFGHPRDEAVQRQPLLDELVGQLLAARVDARGHLLCQQLPAQLFDRGRLPLLPRHRLLLPLRHHKQDRNVIDNRRSC